MVLKTLRTGTGQYFWRSLTFFYQKLIFGVSVHFQRKPNRKQNFQTILVKIFVYFFHIIARILFTRIETELDDYREFQVHRWNTWNWWVPSRPPKIQNFLMNYREFWWHPQRLHEQSFVLGTFSWPYQLRKRAKKETSKNPFSYLVTTLDLISFLSWGLKDGNCKNNMSPSNSCLVTNVHYNFIACFGKHVFTEEKKQLRKNPCTQSVISFFW